MPKRLSERCTTTRMDWFMRNRNWFLGRLLSVSVFLGFFSFVGLSPAQEATPASSTAQSDPLVVQSPGQEIPANSRTPIARGGQSVAGSLFIGPGDELDITVYGAPDLSSHARVE